jgi:hypothetical protein
VRGELHMVRSLVNPSGKLDSALVAARELTVVQERRPERGIEEAQHACRELFGRVVPAPAVEHSQAHRGGHDDIRMGQDRDRNGFLATLLALMQHKNQLLLGAFLAVKRQLYHFSTGNYIL